MLQTQRDEQCCIQLFHCISYILQHSASIVSPIFVDMERYSAAREGHDNVVEYLISLGANVNCFGNQSTPLHAACYYNRSSFYHFFLPLLVLKFICRPGCVRILLQHNADARRKNKFNLTPIQEATPACMAVLQQAKFL